METIEITYFAFGGVVEWIHKIQRTVTQFNQPLATAFTQTIHTQIHLTRQCIVFALVIIVFELHGK